MRRNYHVVSRQGKLGERQFAEFSRNSGQQLLPMVELIERCRLALDEVIEVLGRKTIETILRVGRADRGTAGAGAGRGRRAFARISAGVCGWPTVGCVYRNRGCANAGAAPVAK